MSKDKRDPSLVSVVLPAFNEAAGISEFARSVSAHLEGVAHEIIVVDDGSTDGTWQQVCELSSVVPGLRGIRFSRNFGHQSALLAGIKAARGDVVITMDADGQHPPGVISEMIERWRSGVAVVQGIRSSVDGLGLMKRITSRAYYRIFSWLTEVPIPPGSADFRLLDRSAVELIVGNPYSALFLRGLMHWSGLRTERIEYVPKERLAGETKYSLVRMFRLARQGIVSFSIKPLRFAAILGSIVTVGSLAFLILGLFLRFFGTAEMTRWEWAAGLLALIGGAQLLALGVIGEYIGAVFTLQQGRPLFVISDRCGEKEPPRTQTAPQK